jgi:hypothetical protein
MEALLDSTIMLGNTINIPSPNMSDITTNLKIKKPCPYTVMDDDDINTEHTNTIRRPVIHYITEPKNSTIDNAKRVIAMAMTYDKKTGHVYYGACIFRRDFETEVCKRKNIRRTAEERLARFPNGIIITPNDEIKVNDIAKIIRMAITKIGVKKHSDKSIENIIDDDSSMPGLISIEEDIDIDIIKNKNI